MSRGSREAVEFPAADRIEISIAPFNIAHEFIECRPRFFSSAESVINVLARNCPAARLAHFSKRLELGFWILAREVMILFGMIFKDVAAFAALLFGNSGVKRDVHKPNSRRLR